jgi:periplasmic copper chaperone A
MKTHFLFVFVLLAFLGACAPAAPAGGIDVSNVTVVLPGGNSTGGMDMGQELSGYMQIKNKSGSDDHLVGVTSDFADAMLHETTMNGDVATMKELTSIDLPAGATIEFKHGGLHIMFMNPTKYLKVGDSVNLVLEFEKAGKVTISATVTGE